MLLSSEIIIEGLSKNALVGLQIPHERTILW
jgi:hypothetical protein